MTRLGAQMCLPFHTGDIVEQGDEGLRPARHRVGGTDVPDRLGPAVTEVA